MPLAIFVLLVGVIYFTISLRFINFRFIGKSIQIFFEKEKEKDGTKAVTSRAAFLSAISGSVGLGSISGVAAALFVGGPGAVFWMSIAGFLVMPLRYAEVFLGHFFRTKEKDGTISKFGPYAYIETGLIKEGYSKKLSKFCFYFYLIAILCGLTGALLVLNPLAEMAGSLFLNDNKIAIFAFCVAMAILCLVILSEGLRRIIQSLEGAVSVMALLYMIAVAFILIVNIQNVPTAIALIFTEAFNMQSLYGGILGIIIVSITRVIVATEVGFGSASFFHGKSQNDDSVREGILSMSGPFFASFIFIILNAVAVLATSSHLSGKNGILMVNHMFVSVHPYFSYLLFVIAFLFGLTTAIAWFFYGESSIKQLTKRKSALVVYRMYVFIIISSVGLVSFGVMIRIIDALIVSMVFPNMLALLLLGGVVRREFLKYTSKK